MSNVRHVRELPASDRRRWYVFEADYGGQILATVPVEMIPEWVNRRRLRHALREMNGWPNSDGTSVYVVEDFGAYPEYREFDENEEAYFIHGDCTMPWVERKIAVRLPVGLCFAAVAREPFDEPTKLAGWTFRGWVDGGMGGGRLLDADLWLHYELLFRGQGEIDRICRLLGLPRMESFELCMSHDDEEHAALMCAVLE